MTYTTLITTAELEPRLADPTWTVVDARFDLAQPDWGEAEYRTAHLPGAVYAHLDRDLSGPKTGANGRHPLPDLEELRARLGRWGIGPGGQVVAYDQANGMWASRVWWLLRYLGYSAVAVLDGGWTKWTAEGRPVRAGDESRPAALFQGAPRPELLLTVQQVERFRSDPHNLLIDSRAPERYRGEVEPIDPVAGHIPGARNLYNLSNANADGTLLPPEALRARFRALLGDAPAANVGFYCGSGPAAAHNALALEVAGLSGARVYAGSWSEWCADPGRPVALGQA